MELEEISKWEKTGQDLHKLVNKLSSDFKFKIVLAFTLYICIVLLSLFLLFKLEQQKVFGLRLFDLPLWPTIDSISFLTINFFTPFLSMTIFFSFFFILFKCLKFIKSDPNQRVLFKDWAKRYRLHHIFKVVYLKLTLLLVIIYFMYKTSGGIVEGMCLFGANEFFYQIFFSNEEKKRTTVTQNIFGLLLVDGVLILFIFLLSFIYFTLSLGASPGIKLGVDRLICSEPQLVSLRIDGNERMAGWQLGQSNDFLSMRRKDSNGLYETVSMNKGKIVGITYLNRYESIEERINAFPNCSTSFTNSK